MSQKYPSTAKFRGFALSNIDEATRAKIRKDPMDGPSIFPWIRAITEEGYKFSLRYADEQSAYQAMLFGADPGGQNAGLSLSIWHTDAMIAITALRVIHEDVYAGKWMTQADFDW